MSSSMKLINELEKCFSEKTAVELTQLVTIKMPSECEDLDKTNYNYKTDIFPLKPAIFILNKKVFECEDTEMIKQYLETKKM